MSSRRGPWVCMWGCPYIFMDGQMLLQDLFASTWQALTYVQGVIPVLDSGACQMNQAFRPGFCPEVFQELSLVMH